MKTILELINTMLNNIKKDTNNMLSSILMSKNSTSLLSINTISNTTTIIDCDRVEAKWGHKTEPMNVLAPKCLQLAVQVVFGRYFGGS